MQAHWSKKEKEKWGREVTKQFNVLCYNTGHHCMTVTKRDCSLLSKCVYSICDKCDKNKSHLGEKREKFVSLAPSHLKLPTGQTPLRLFTLYFGLHPLTPQCQSRREIPCTYRVLFHPTPKMEEWPDMNGYLIKREKEKGDQENLKRHIRQKTGKLGTVKTKSCWVIKVMLICSFGQARGCYMQNEFQITVV